MNFQVERQELKTCTDILTDILTFLHIRLQKEKNYPTTDEEHPTSESDSTNERSADPTERMDNPAASISDYELKDCEYYLNNSSESPTKPSSAIWRDVGVVAEHLLHPLIQTILLMDRQTKSAVVVRSFQILIERGI